MVDDTKDPFANPSPPLPKAKEEGYDPFAFEADDEFDPVFDEKPGLPPVHNPFPPSDQNQQQQPQTLERAHFGQPNPAGTPPTPQINQGVRPSAPNFSNPQNISQQQAQAPISPQQPVEQSLERHNYAPRQEALAETPAEIRIPIAQPIDPYQPAAPVAESPQMARPIVQQPTAVHDPYAPQVFEPAPQANYQEPVYEQAAHAPQAPASQVPIERPVATYPIQTSAIQTPAQDPYLAPAQDPYQAAPQQPTIASTEVRPVQTEQPSAYTDPSRGSTIVPPPIAPSNFQSTPVASSHGQTEHAPQNSNAPQPFQPQKPPMSRRKKSWIKRLAFTGGGILALLLLIIFILPFLLPSKTIAREISKQVEAATGWQLEIDGPVSVGLLPTPRFKADDVSISIDGQNELVRVGTLRFGINFGAIFSGNVQLSEISLSRPVVDLLIDESGRASWQSNTLPGISTTGDEAVSDTGSALAALERLQIDSFTVRDGLVRYQDLSEGSNFNIENIRIDTSTISLNNPLSVESNFTYHGERFNFNTTLQQPRASIDNTRTPIDASIESDHINSTFGGTIDFGLGPAFGGQVGLNIPSLPNFANWLGATLPDNTKSLNSFSASAELAANPDVVDISNFALKIGEEMVRGLMRADISGSSPAFSGQLTSDGIDMPTLMSALGLGGPAQPKIAGDLSLNLEFAAIGSNVDALITSMNARGNLGLRGATITNTGLGGALGEPEADVIGNVVASATINNLNTPIGLVGQADWRGERFDLSGQFGAGQMLANGLGPAQFALNSQRFTGGINGTLTNTGEFDGNVNLETRSLRGLLTWLNQPIGPGTSLAGFKYDGRFAMDANVINFDDAQFQLDGTAGRGSGTLTLGPIPTLQASLALARLDLTPYISSDGSNAPQSAGSLPGISSTDDGWSNAAIDLSALSSINANLAITAQEIVLGDLRTGRSSVVASINKGQLTADLTEMNLYDGRGAGRLLVKADESPPTYAMNFDLASLSALPFLTDASGFTRIEGFADLAIALQGRGTSEQSIVSSLDGEVRMLFRDGAIRGINIPKMVRTLSARTLVGWQQNGIEKTDFSEFSGSFALANGLASTRDIRLVGPLVRATGAGTVDLPAKRLEMRFDPKIVASLQGQGNADQMAGLRVPIVVAGTFAQPRIYPDIAGILDNPTAAFEQLRQLGGPLAAAGDLVSNAGAGIGNQLENSTGVNVNQIIQNGQIDRDSAVNQGVNLIDRLVGGNQPQTQLNADGAPRSIGGIPVPLANPLGPRAVAGPANAAPRFMTPAEVAALNGGTPVTTTPVNVTPTTNTAPPASGDGPIDLLSGGSGGPAPSAPTVAPGSGNPQGPSNNPIGGILRGIFGR